MTQLSAWRPTLKPTPELLLRLVPPLRPRSAWLLEPGSRAVRGRPTTLASPASPNFAAGLTRVDYEDLALGIEEYMTCR